jgi:hypothetical protein
MTNHAQKIFDEFIWADACRLYRADGGVGLYRQPAEVQDKYKDQASKELREYLASCGMV